MNELNPMYIFPIFIAMWLGILALISLLGGWLSLSKKFPMSETHGPVMKSFIWKSLNLNYLGGYRSCVNIKVTEKGLILKLSFIFSFLHSPIFIPWASIQGLIYKEGLFKRIIFRAGDNRIVIYGKVAQFINKQSSIKSFK